MSQKDYLSEDHSPEDYLKSSNIKNPRKAPMVEAYKRFFKNYVNFEGRASRAEYWWFTLFNFLIIFAWSILLLSFEGTILIGGLAKASLADIIFIAIMFLVFFFYQLAVCIPSISLTVRRLHDSDKSGWLMLTVLIPYVGGLVIFILTLLEGTEGPNKYGEPSDF